MQIKKDIKLSSFADDMAVYVKNLKEPKKPPGANTRLQ